MRYDGFISYSHAADGQLAPALQKALQRLAKPWFRRRSLEIFRDETGLSVDPHLWGAIVKALDDSEWFVLLTSPLAAQSEWVNREIEHWKAHRSVDRILPVVTDGHWQWDEATGDFTADSDAVPPALHGVFGDEPRHLDLRWAHDEEQLDLNNGRFRNAVAEVAAPLHGRSKDEIEGEDVRQHRRTVRVAWSAAASLAILTVAAVVASLFAVNNAHRAEQRRIVAESQRLANYSQNEPATSDLAFLLAAQGYRLGANPLTETALFRSVTDMPPEIKERIPTDATVAAVAYSDAADRIWVATTEGALTAYRFSDGQQVARNDFYFRHGVVAMARLGDDEVVITDGTETTTFDGELAPSDKRVSPGVVSSLAVENSTGRIAGGSVDGKVFVWEPNRRSPTTIFVGVPHVAAADYMGVTALTWTLDGGLIVAGKDGGLRRYDVDAPEAPLWEQGEANVENGSVSAAAVLDDNTLVTGGTDGTIGFRNAATGLPTDAETKLWHKGSVRGLVATGDKPEYGSVASVGDDGFLVFFNHLTGEPALPPARIGEEATSVAWDQTARLRGVVGVRGGATLLDYGRDQLPAVAQQVEGWSDVAAVAMSSDGHRVAVVRTRTSSNKPISEVVLTDPTRLDPNDPSVQVDGVVEQITFTPDGSLVLASTDDGSVAVWDGKAATASLTEVAVGAVVSQLAVSPDGGTVATGSIDLNSNMDAPVRLWRLDGMKLMNSSQTTLTTFGYGLAFSPDGEHLIIGGAGTFAIYPLDGGEIVKVNLTDDSTRSLTIAPDGKTVAVGLYSGPIRFYDLETGKPTGDELRQADRASAIAFRDNNVLVTVSSDGDFKLWDLISLRSLSNQTLSGVNSGATGGRPVAPSLGLGRDVAVTASIVDRRLVKWSLNPDSWIREGCAQHLRDLTDSEKSRFDLAGASPVCPAR
jgi:WD40 repeat protein